MLVEFLRGAANVSVDPEIEFFQILLNTHSPKVMAALKNREIVAADSVVSINPKSHVRSTKTRMRPDIQSTGDMFDPEKHLSRFEVEHLLQNQTDAA